MYNFYNITADKTDEWQALEKIKKEAFDEGYKQGINRGLSDNVNNEKHYTEGFKRGREAGFLAGFEAAKGKAGDKIEAAYEQGKADAAKLQPVRKNGCGY